MNSYEKKTDCMFYAKDGDEKYKDGCKILTERVCEKKKCSFYEHKTEDKK